jgi:DNA polymerase I
VIVRDYDSLNYVIDNMKEAQIIAFDTETADWGFPKTHVTGFSISWADMKGAYIPVGHRTGEYQLPAEEVYAALKPILEDPKKVIVMHNSQYDIKVARLMGIYMTDNIFDTMTASWLDDTEAEHGLKPLTLKYFNYQMTELADICPKEKHPNWKNDKVYRTDLVPIQELGDYAFDDSIYTRKLYFHYKPLMDANYKKVFEELETELALCLAEMEAFGAYVNKPILEAHGTRMKSEIEKAETLIYSLRPGSNKDVPFNINSPKQMNQVLFHECGIKPIGAPGKSGDYSTKSDYLEVWALKGHEIAKAILRFRELDKLYGTYIKGMGGAITEKGRIHCRFNRHGTRTGRLSSSKPNLQNIPNNREFPIREAFQATPAELSVTGKPRKLVVLDFSQIEYRVGAHLAKDEAMLDVYITQGGDLHSETARSVWTLVTEDGRNAMELSLKEVKQYFETQRRDAKAINFGIFYEMGDKSLAAEINKGKKAGEPPTTQKEASEIIANFKRRFKGVAMFLDWSHTFAEKNGFVRTITKRKRHLPMAQIIARTKDDNIKKSKAMRQAVNSQVQGSAADIMGIAMRNIRRKFKELGWWETRAMITNQVHDEISIECDEDIAEEVFTLAKDLMENAVKISCPIVAEGSIGDNWWEAK